MSLPSWFHNDESKHAVSDVSDLMDEAVKHAEGVSKKVLECLLKRSPKLRKCVKERPTHLGELLDDETIVIHGNSFKWLVERSEFVENAVENEGDDCPAKHFLVTPEQKRWLDYGEPCVFPFLKHIENEDPVGEYMKDSEGEISFELNLELKNLPNALDYLLWKVRKPKDQLEDLISWGLFVPVDKNLAPRGHNFPHKILHAKARLAKQQKRVDASLAHFERQLFSSHEDNNDNDSYDSYDSNNGHVRKSKGPSVKIGHHANKYRAYLPSEKPSRAHKDPRKTKRKGKGKGRSTRRH
jgi:hypothetical protein